MRIRSAAVAALLLATVTACGSGTNSAKPGDSPAATSAAATITPYEEPTEEETADAGDEPHALTDTVAYENEVSVTLAKFTRKVSSDYASPASTPYIKFTIKVVNASAKTVDTTGLQVNCVYGTDGQTSESVFDDGLNGGPNTKLLAKRSINVPWGCALPKGETSMQIEVTPDFESEVAIFTGNIK